MCEQADSKAMCWSPHHNFPSPDHKVHKLAGYDHDLADRFSLEQCGDLPVAARSRLELWAIGVGPNNLSTSNGRVSKEPTEACLFEVLVGCQSFSDRAFCHQEETDGVAERVRLVELGLQHCQSSSMAFLVDPDHLDIGVGRDIGDEGERAVARMFSGMGQCDEFDQHVIVGNLERPGLEISDRVVMPHFSGVKAAQEP